MSVTIDDLPDILERILEGESQREIAKHYGCTRHRLLTLLETDDATKAKADWALANSAEAWLDRGLEPLQAAIYDLGMSANAARAYAQECARRAAVRNTRYREGREAVTVQVTNNVALLEESASLRDRLRALPRPTVA